MAASPGASLMPKHFDFALRGRHKPAMDPALVAAADVVESVDTQDLKS